MRSLGTYFKWKYLRNKHRLTKTYGGKRKLNVDEQLIKNVLIKAVSNPNNTILISPLSKMIYIQTKNNEYTLVLAENKIKITNHKLFIETYTDTYFSEELFNIVYFYIEKYRTEMDRKISENEVDGLKYMLNQLTEIK